MILNGKDQPLSSGNNFVPDVGNGVMQFMQNVVVGVMQKVNLNGYTSEIPLYKKTMAVKQSFTSRQLQIKPEGQRGWQWYKIHMLNNIKLKLDDRFLMNAVKYRVMRSSEYTEYGYTEYEVIEDYQG